MKDRFSRRLVLSGALGGAGSLAVADTVWAKGKGDNYQIEEAAREKATTPETKEVAFDLPIITYHEVFNRAVFESQVDRLLGWGFQIIGVSNMQRIRKEQSTPWLKKPLLLTFDDILKSQERNAFPVLVEKNIPGVFCVMPDRVRRGGDKRHDYSGNDVIKMYEQAGMDIVIHTFDHPVSLPALYEEDKGAWEAQIVEPKYRAAEIVGNRYVPKGFCYPNGNGAVHAPTVKLVSEHYSFAFSTVDGYQQTPGNKFAMRRLSSDAKDNKTWKLLEQLAKM